MISFLWALVPSRARLYGAIAIAAAVLLALVRADAKRDARRDMNEADHEHADEIRRRIRRDTDKRVRELDDAGWRDD